MIIEFYTPCSDINESTICYVRDEMMKLHKQYKTISRAGISFKQKRKQSGPEKICEISLFIAGNSINAKGICKSFDHACKKAVAILNDNIVSGFKQKVHSL